MNFQFKFSGTMLYCLKSKISYVLLNISLSLSLCLSLSMGGHLLSMFNLFFHVDLYLLRSSSLLQVRGGGGSSWQSYMYKLQIANFYIKE